MSEVDSAKAVVEESTTTVEEEEKKHDGKDPSTTTTTTSTSVIDSIAERLHFFFSDANIRQDNFIRRFLLSSSSDNNNSSSTSTDASTYPGYITIDTLLRFNTIKQYTTDPLMIIKAVETSPLLISKLKLSDDKKAVTRIVPFTIEQMDDNIPLSIYLKNIPYTKKHGKNDDGTNNEKQQQQQKYNCTHDEIKQLFVQYGPVALVKFRFRVEKKDNCDNDNEDDDDVDNSDIQPSKQSNVMEETGNKSNKNQSTKKKFKTYPIGAAFVEFENIESLQKAADDVLTIKDGIEIQPKRTLTVNGNVLQAMLLQEYIDSSNKNNKRKEVEATEENGTDKNDETDDVKDNNDATTTSSNKKYEIDWKPGCVIRITGLDGCDCDREAIIDAIGKGLQVSTEHIKYELKVYVDYSRGQKDGAIRFQKPTDCDIPAFCTKLQNGDVLINNTKVSSAHILQGEEEQQYWDTFIEFKTKQMQEKEKQQQKYHQRNNHHGGNRKNYKKSRKN